ncbi:MAG: hypothetical protein WBP16_12970 [Ferruginibacter sp.]
MKKFKTVLTAIVMLFTFTAFASEPVKVSPAIKAAFANDFSKASEVVWEKSNDFYFASFTLNDVNIDAAYSEEGLLLGTSRVISLEQLPLNISMAVEEKYKGYLVHKIAIELTYEGLTRYYVTAENDSEKLKLKCYSNGDLNVENRMKKIKG